MLLYLVNDCVSFYSLKKIHYNKFIKYYCLNIIIVKAFSGSIYKLLPFRFFFQSKKQRQKSKIMLSWGRKTETSQLGSYLTIFSFGWNISQAIQINKQASQAPMRTKVVWALMTINKPQLVSLWLPVNNPSFHK